MMLCLGTAQFARNYGLNNIQSHNIFELLNFCQNNGIYDFDTSILYGNSIRILSDHLKGNVNIYTKLKIIESNNIEMILNSIKKELDIKIKILKNKKIRGLLFHNPQDFIKFNKKEITTIFKTITDVYKIDKYGFSFYDVIHFRDLYEKFEFNLIQIPYNILDKSFFETDMFDLSSMNIEIHARSVFLQGLLVSNLDNLKDLKLSKFIKDVREDLKNKKINIIDACIGFVKQNNSINKIVFGVENINQLKEVHESFHNYQLNIDLKYDYHDKFSLNPKNW